MNMSTSDFDIESTVIEHVINGNNTIDWNHWFLQPYWKVEEACFLLHLTNPNVFDTVASEYESLKKINPIGEYVKSKEHLFKLIETAKREQLVSIDFNNVTPIKWVEWAKSKGIEIPGVINNFVMMNKSCDMDKTLETSNMNKGFYTIRLATEEIKKHASFNYEATLNKLKRAVQNGEIKMYAPYTYERHIYNNFAKDFKDFHEVTTIKDLNRWLDNNEVIEWRFTETQSFEKLSPNELAIKQSKKSEPKTIRRYRLYAEIEEIENYKNMGIRKVIEQLKVNISKDGTCVKNITSSNNIEWLDWQGNKQVTSFDNLGTWLRRRK